jgi:hypothetical protein
LGGVQGVSVSVKWYNMLVGFLQGGLNVVLKTGATSILLRDALRRPLAEIELGEVDAGLRRVDDHVMRVSLLVMIAATEK